MVKREKGHTLGKISSSRVGREKRGTNEGDGRQEGSRLVFKRKQAPSFPVKKRGWRMSRGKLVNRN